MSALSFTAGVITGAALMMANRWSIKKAVEIERSRSEDIREENCRMREEMMNLTHHSDCRAAYEKGKREGRKDPVSNAERFARNFEGRNVQFRGGKMA